MELLGGSERVEFGPALIINKRTYRPAVWLKGTFSLYTDNRSDKLRSFVRILLGVARCWHAILNYIH